MKTHLSSIAGAVLLAAATDASHAQVTVNAYQNGYGNQAYTEQVAAQNATATIRQVGNNNTAGIPNAFRGGVVQIGSSDVYGVITQNGDRNNASITQRQSVRGGARISQLGVGNTGIAVQTSSAQGDINLYQNGAANAANLSQSGVTSFLILAYQTGNANRLTVQQFNSGFAGFPRASRGA